MAMSVGDRLPDVILPTLDGRPFDFQTLHRRPALVFMWASW